MAFRGGIKINLLPIAAFNAGANLAGRPSLPRHAICVEAFFGTGATFRAVQPLKTTAQALMSQGTITAAIARKLI